MIRSIANFDSMADSRIDGARCTCPIDRGFVFFKFIFDFLRSKINKFGIDMMGE